MNGSSLRSNGRFEVVCASLCVVASVVACGPSRTWDFDVVAVDARDVPAAEVGPDVTCPAGQTACGGVCVNTRTNAMHCSACNMPCPANTACVDGMCGAPCTPPNTVCGAACVDTRASASNCGRCGNACGAGELCRNGICLGGLCSPPRLVCMDMCIDAQNDAMNCGRCGNACAATEICANGTCQMARRDSGQACTSDAVCGGRGTACLLETSGWAGGYCIYGCRTDTDCPGPGVCATTVASPYCLRRCTTDTDCRSGYHCINAGLTGNICYPRCTRAPALLCGPYRCDTFSDNCQNVMCVVASQCSTGSTCDVSSRECRCTASTDCGAGFTCITSTGRCGCTSDAVCSPGRSCNVMTGRCE